MTCSASEVFCDYLRVSYRPDDIPAGLVPFLHSVGAECYATDSSVTSYNLGTGNVRLELRKAFALVSLSGAALASLRLLSQYHQLLAVLASHPHRVTRLDAALDVSTDSASVIADLRRRYPQECSLLGKGLPVSSLLGPRLDGVESGTFYVGHRTRAHGTARVYDKQKEAWDKRREVLPPTTRYEVTASRDFGATLRDASSPSSLFWHIASPSLLPAPPDVEQWVPRDYTGWEFKAPEKLPAEVLRDRVEFSSELESLIAYADRDGGPGRSYLLRLLARKLQLEDRLVSAGDFS